VLAVLPTLASTRQQRCRHAAHALRGGWQREPPQGLPDERAQPTQFFSLEIKRIS